MFQINGSNIKPKNTGRRGIEYLANVKCDDNLRIGESYDSTGAVQAKGTLYPTTMNNNTNVGAIQSLVDALYKGSSDFDLDNESYTNNEVKFKTAPNLFQGFKKLVSVSLAFIQKVFTTVTTGLWTGTGQLRIQKAFTLSSTTFLFVYYQTGGTAGTYAVVATVNASTGALTFGTPVVLNTVVAPATNYADVENIATNKFVYVQQNTDTTISNIVFTVSGTTITAGTAVNQTITSASLGTVRIRVNKVDTDKYLTHYWATSNSNNFAYISTVSGTVPTHGSNTSLFGGQSGNYPICAMKSTTEGLFMRGNYSNNLYVQAFTISGTTFTLGSDTQIGVNGADNQLGDYGTGRVLPNGLYYYHSTYSSPHDYYIEVTGTTPVLVDKAYPNALGGFSYGTRMSQDYYVDANEWCYVQNQGSEDWLIKHKYNSGTGRVTTTRSKLAVGTTNQWGGNSITQLALVKCGSQFITIGSTTSDATNFYYQTGQAGSAEVYFEAEVTACATLSNPTYGWAIAKADVNKSIIKNTAYFSLKNVTGNTVLIKTKDWLFEVE